MRAVVSGFFFAAVLLIGGAASAQIALQPSTASGPCSSYVECQSQYNKADTAYQGYVANFNSSIGKGYGSAYETNYLVNMRDALVQRYMYSDAGDYYNGAWWASKPTFDVSPYMSSSNNLVSSRSQGVGVDSASMLAVASFGSQGTATTAPSTDPGTGGATTTPTDPGTGGGSTTPTDPGTGGSSTSPAASGASLKPITDAVSMTHTVVGILAVGATLMVISVTILAAGIALKLIRGGSEPVGGLKPDLRPLEERPGYFDYVPDDDSHYHR